ncbi:MAG: CapA family protein, partial [Ignavibacteriales bacterium]|nr:CapA family protein [Ignavibacteriales bacterium]
MTLFFAGDVVLSNHIETQVGNQPGYVFERWNEVDTSAIFMFNLEHPITTARRKVEKEYNFKMHPKYLRTLREGRVTLINAANNHIADYGIAGIDDTMKYLDSVGIRYVGIGKNLEEARRPVIIEKNGKRIGFLGYHGGGKFAATRTRTGLAPRYEPYIIEDVKQLRSQVDYVVVNFHWGTELAEKPDRSQIALAHDVIDAGADLIVGHHPHVLQGVET